MDADLRLKSPSCVIITGGSNCGKTYLIEKLLSNHEQCFEKPIEQLCWVYSKHAKDEHLFERLKKIMPVQFHEGYPESKISDNTLFSVSREAHKVLVLDDIFTGPAACKSLFDIFNIISHHNNVTCIVVVQNLAGSTAAQKGCLSTLLRSTTYVILFASRKMVPIIRYIATNYFPGEGYRVTEPFNHIIKQSVPYKYLMLDFASQIEALQVREGGLTPDEECFGFVFPE